MPSHKFDSTYSCCTSRDPPSPDGLSPRPAISPIKLLQKTTNAGFKYSGASTSSIHKAEVRKAIFDSDKEDRFDTSGIDRANGDPAVDAVLGGGSSEQNHSTVPVKPRSNLSNLNLKAVTQKLKKRLSRESALNKRNSRASIGTSEEEIERRAELRRIRQKRIQEELSDEGIYDADAKSLESITGTPSPIEVQELGGLPALAALKAPGPSKKPSSLLGVKPLEEQRHHFSNYQISKNSDALRTPTYHSVSSHTTRKSSRATSRRHSSPVFSDFDIIFADPRTYVPLRKQSSVGEIPLTPSIEPQRLPSFAEPTTSSWRLSFTSTNRAEHLRKLSRQHTESSHSRASLFEAGGPCPSSKLIFTPGLRGTGQQLLWTNERGFDSGVSRNFSLQCPVSEFFRESSDVDGPEDDSNVIPLHEMGISRQLASRGLQSSSSSPQLSSWGSHQRAFSSTIGTSTIQRPQRSYNPTKTSDSIPLSERIPQSWGQIVHDGGSPSYRTKTCSSTPLPHDSRPNRLPVQDCQPLPSKHGVTSEGSEADLLLSKPAGQTSEDTGSNLVPPSTPYARRSTIDNSSIMASETDSFRERETELLAVQARFASVDSKRVPSTPRSSRFHEEFHLESPYMNFEEEVISKPSGCAESRKPASQSYDGQNGIADLLAVPLPDFDPNLTPRRSPGAVSPSDDISQLNAVWGRAIKLNAEARAGDVAGNLQVPIEKDGLRNRVPVQTSSSGGPLGSRSWKKGSKINVGELEQTAAQYQKRFLEQLAVKEAVMDDWEAEMDASAQKARAKSRNTIKKNKPPVGADRRFPLSWSRYPSHSRDERCLSASPSERVESHDFAMTIDSAGQRGPHTCREVGNTHIHEDDPDWQKYEGEIMGMKARLGDKISQKLYKIETHGGGSKTFEFQTDGRRGSMRTAAKLAFPELTLLPVRPSSIEEEDIKFEESNQTRLREERRMITAKLATYGDGSEDEQINDGQNEKQATTDSHISIADPRFYDDCMISIAPDESNKMNGVFAEVLNDETRHPSKRFKTWSGAHWHKYRPNRRRVSLGTMASRRRTDGYCADADETENLEKHKVLQIEEAET